MTVDFRREEARRLTEEMAFALFGMNSPNESQEKWDSRGREREEERQQTVLLLFSLSLSKRNPLKVAVWKRRYRFLLFVHSIRPPMWCESHGRIEFPVGRRFPTGNVGTCMDMHVRTRCPPKGKSKSSSSHTSEQGGGWRCLVGGEEIVESWIRIKRRVKRKSLEPRLELVEKRHKKEVTLPFLRAALKTNKLLY